MLELIAGLGGDDFIIIVIVYYGAYFLASLLILAIISLVIYKLRHYLQRRRGKVPKDGSAKEFFKVLGTVIAITLIAIVIFIVIPTVIADRKRKIRELKCNEIYGYSGSPNRPLCEGLD